MSSAAENSPPRDERLEAILVELIEASERGEPLDLAPYVARYPELAAELEEFADDWRRFRTRAAAVAPPSDQGAAEADSPAPTRIGDYEILERLGHGGMGVVYKARHQALQRVVALKMLLDGRAATPEQVRRFRAETESVARLEHPGIVPIFEVGEHEGLPFYTMRYVPGENLAARVAAGPLDPREAARIVRELAAAIEYAHRRGVVHRDLKPSNVLLERATDEDTANGARGAEGCSPRITDFGLAKRLTDDAPLTLSGQIVGTPSYMAPEQLPGAASDVGPAVDIYALGAILYCVTTGRPPFQSADPLDTLRQVRDDEVIRPRTLNSSIPRDLETITLRCLERSPARRFATAAELLAELDRFLAGDPIRSRPVGVVERVGRWGRRNPIVALLLAAVVGATSLAAALAIDAGLAASRRERAEREQRQELERTVYASLIRQSDLEWQMNNVNRADQLLDQCPPELRDWEWRFLKRRAHQERLVCHADAAVRQVEYRADGARFVAGGLDRYVRTWDAESGAELSRWRFEAIVMSVAWSADGQWIGVGLDDGQVIVCRASDGQRQWAREVHPGRTNQVAFSVDSRRLASGGEDGRVVVWDVASGEELHAWSTELDAVLGVAFAPTGDHVAAVGEGDPQRAGNSIYVWNGQSGERIARIATDAARIHRVAFAGSEDRLLAADDDGTIGIWNVADQELERTFDEHDTSIRSLAVSREGRLAASGDKSGAILIWRLEDQRTVRSLRGHHLSVLGLSFRPSDEELASCGMDGQVRVWRVGASESVLRLAGHRDRVNEVATSPAADLVASVGRDQTVRLWDVRTGSSQSVGKGHEAMVLAVAFERRGRWFVSADEEGRVLRWDAADGRRLDELRCGDSAIWSVDVHPDGERLALGCDDGTIGLWDLARRTAVWTSVAHRGGVKGVRFRPDGRELATCGDDGHVRLWSVDAGVRTHDLKRASGPAWSVSYSRDGRQLAATAGDGAARVWRLNPEPTPHVTCAGHTGVVYSAAFSADGSRLATAGFDNTVKVWDLRTGQDLLTLHEPNWSVNSVAFTADGQTLVAGCSDWRVHMWRAGPSDKSR